jgi:hypothetical protein
MSENVLLPNRHKVCCAFARKPENLCFSHKLRGMLIRFPLPSISFVEEPKNTIWILWVHIFKIESVVWVGGEEELCLFTDKSAHLRKNAKVLLDQQENCFRWQQSLSGVVEGPSMCVTAFLAVRVCVCVGVYRRRREEKEGWKHNEREKLTRNIFQ